MPRWIKEIRNSNTEISEDEIIRMRNEERLKNYAKGRIDPRNEYQGYSKKECEAILRHSVTDRELALSLGRTVQAIQGKRHKLRNRAVL